MEYNQEVLKQNLAALRQRIASSCANAGRGTEEISLVAVSKGRPLEQIQEVFSLGVSDIGESRVQETVYKYNQFNSAAPKLLNSLNSQTLYWHMIGRLQTNKVREAVRIFDLIQSVDSLRLAEVISKEAARIHKLQDILIEVRTSPEETKSGLSPQEAPEVIRDISRLPNINLKGLMTIAPWTDDPRKSRPYFRILRELSQKIDWRPTTRDRRPILSMGMSNDFEAAIAEGSTMLRIGRAIFE